jgi:hypothetical protein
MPGKVGPATRETCQLERTPPLTPVSFLQGLLKTQLQKDGGGLTSVAHSGQTFITLKG